MIIRSDYPDIAVPEVSMPEFLWNDLTPADSARTAVIDTADGREYTYGQLTTLAGRVAAALAERGIGRDDTVAIAAPNCAEYPAVFHGVLQAGAVASTVNPLYTPKELAYQLRESRARILVTAPGGLDCARAAVREHGVGVAEIIVLGQADPTAGPVRETEFDRFAATTADAPRVTISPGDLAVLPYSSGTTGLPKGVMLTHRNLVANVLQMRPLNRLCAGSRALAVLPLFHIYGMNGIMNMSLFKRATVVTMPRFSLEAFLKAIEQHRIDHAYIAPPIAVALAKSPLVDSYDLSSLDLIISAAAPLDIDLARALSTRFGVTVLQGYGLTEASPCTHGIPADRPDIDRGSIGVLMPGVQARVVDPATGADVLPGERGEMWCRGPNIMRGYLNHPEATAQTVDADGFLHTGDLVTVDADGVFRVVDRLKELIKYNGYQVAPAELEAVLLTHEGIADAAVIGVPDSDGQEVPKAFVVPRRDSHPGLGTDEVLSFVAARVAPYKKVRAVEFIDQIPKSPSGKILRRALREREQAGPQTSAHATDHWSRSPAAPGESTPGPR